MFSASVVDQYERYMVPLVFAPYAAELAARVAALAPTRVLEVAAGTGALTRSLAGCLPASTEIVATDLSQPMIDHAAAIGAGRPITWRQADALALPFEAGEFAAVVCQFGAMFFPDKVRAYAEAHRVLAPGGTYLLAIWDRIDASPVAAALERTLAARFPADPPRFLSTLPHGYHAVDVVVRELAAAGFAAPRVDHVVRTGSATARDVALAFCTGTPLRTDLAARAELASIVDDVARALARDFAGGDLATPIEFPMAAFVIEAIR